VVNADAQLKVYGVLPEGSSREGLTGRSPPARSSSTFSSSSWRSPEVWPRPLRGGHRSDPVAEDADRAIAVTKKAVEDLGGGQIRRRCRCW
jgi:hypothetical protein